MAAERDERRRPQSERLLEVARELVSELDLEAVLARVLDAARELTESEYAALGILDERKAELERFLYRGIDEETRQLLGSLPRGHGILGELIRRPQPLRIANIGEHPHSYGFPPGHPPMTTFLGAPIVIGGEAWGNLYLTDKSEGREFDQADEDLVVLLAQWASVAIDNARLHEQLLRRRSELERAVRGLEANVTIARAVAGETEPERVLELVAKRGRALLGVRTLMVLLLEEDRLVVAAIAGEGGPQIGARLPLEEPLLGEVVRSERPERVADTSSRARALCERLEVPPAAALLVPMAFRARPRGVLAGFDRSGEEGGRFSADDELVASSFAAAAATAIFTARTVESEKLQRSLEAAEQERRRWARELHDETLQELGGLSVALQSASAQPGEEGMRSAVERALEHAQRSIEGVYALINELRPTALDELGLEAALEVLVDRARTLNDLEVECSFEAGTEPGLGSRLSPELETVVYRLVQEAVNNAIKHAQATRVEIRVSEQDGVLHARIADDGVGFDPERTNGGFGLTGMRERAALLGGKVAIDSTIGGGTVVQGELPLASALD